MKLLVASFDLHEHDIPASETEAQLLAAICHADTRRKRTGHLTKTR